MIVVVVAAVITATISRRIDQKHAIEQLALHFALSLNQVNIALGRVIALMLVVMGQVVRHVHWMLQMLMLMTMTMTMTVSMLVLVLVLAMMAISMRYRLLLFVQVVNHLTCLRLLRDQNGHIFASRGHNLHSSTLHSQVRWYYILQGQGQGQGQWIDNK